MMPDKNQEKLSQLYRELLIHLGEDVNREGLKKTPDRAAIALQHLTQGYHMDLETLVNDALFTSNMDEMVLLKDIELYSLCEHHLLPFVGKCHVAYIPNGKVLGVSKIARIVDLFARRLQIQEQLTQQIAQAIQDSTQAKGVAVVIEAQHFCMMMRGVEKQNAKMTTSVMLGIFETMRKQDLNYYHCLKQHDFFYKLAWAFGSSFTAKEPQTWNL